MRCIKVKRMGFGYNIATPLHRRSSNNVAVFEHFSPFFRVQVTILTPIEELFLGHVPPGYLMEPTAQPKCHLARVSTAAVQCYHFASFFLTRFKVLWYRLTEWPFETASLLTMSQCWLQGRSGASFQCVKIIRYWRLHKHNSNKFISPPSRSTTGNHTPTIMDINMPPLGGLVEGWKLCYIISLFECDVLWWQASKLVLAQLPGF